MTFRTAVITCLLALLCVAIAPAQTSQPPAAAPVITLPAAGYEVLLFSGGQYNSKATSRAAGVLGGLYPISASTTLGALGTFAAKQTNGVPAIAIQMEAVQQVGSIGKIPIYLLADIGPAFAASDPAAVLEKVGTSLGAATQNVGTNVGYAAATGAAAAIQLPWSNLVILPSVRVVKGSLNDSQIVFGVSLGKKVTITRTR